MIFLYNDERNSFFHTSIQITWLAATYATSYKVSYTSDYGEDPNYQEETVIGVSLTFNGLEPGTI
jgi:hypothetical protein